MYQSPGESEDELIDDGNFDKSPRELSIKNNKKSPGIVSFTVGNVEHTAKINSSNSSLVHDKYGVINVIDWIEQHTSKRFERYIL